MGARQTSIDCYNQIKAEGLLSKRRLQIYEVLLENGPLSGTEIAILFKKKHFITGHSEGVRNRITELVSRGVICDNGTKTCNITGKTVTEWDLTDRLPVKVKNISAKKRRAEEAINGLRELYQNRRKASGDDWKKVSDLINNI
jgi:DNA-binding Lrp family transcriptional regulator